MKIEEITVCLHCGCNKEIVKTQMESFLDLGIKVNFNNRIDRYPKAYPSYSQLINHSIATSPSEWVFLINDRTTCTKEHNLKIINLLEQGFASVFLYNVGYMAFSKELVRNIGWWDERFLLGGWEDRDWVYRLKHANLALYESQEAYYDYSWKSPLQEVGSNCRLSQPHWDKKWDQKYNDAIVKIIPEERYEHWDLFLGDSKPEIKNSWKPWSESILSVGYDKPNSGPSASSMIKNRNIFNYEQVKDKIK